jgi:hypothetical protein
MRASDMDDWIGSSRMREIQTTLSERALELLALPQENWCRYLPPFQQHPVLES